VPAPLRTKRKKQGDNIGIFARNLTFFVGRGGLLCRQMCGNRCGVGIAILY
jgi:hypothetical protein